MPILDLPNGYYELPPGKLANIATYLEMKALPERKLAAFAPELSLIPVGDMPTADYRSHFKAVGQNLLWFSRLLMSDDKLQSVLANPAIDSYVFKRGDQMLGLLELNFEDAANCELAFFGLVPEAVGSGLGRMLMDEAIRRAFAKPTERLWLHTCTLDHPAALLFYLRSSFTPYARMVEVHDDPRLQGKLPLTAAPQVPVLG
jgi:ribosomal protein S18 acetylase RimI-like enzyme